VSVELLLLFEVIVLCVRVVEVLIVFELLYVVDFVVWCEGDVGLCMVLVVNYCGWVWLYVDGWYEVLDGVDLVVDEDFMVFLLYECELVDFLLLNECNVYLYVYECIVLLFGDVICSFDLVVVYMLGYFFFDEGGYYGEYGLLDVI